MSDDEMERELWQLMRVMMTTGGQSMEMLARARQRRTQEKMAQVDAAARQAEQAAQQTEEDAISRDREWVDARRSTYQQTGYSDWQDNATLGDWTTAYMAAREVRDQRGTPDAAKACEFIRGKVADDFDVDLAREYNRMTEAQGRGDDNRIGEGRAEVDAENLHAEADRTPPKQGGEEVLEPEVLTEEEANRRYRHHYVGTGGDWVANHDAAEIGEAYRYARENEGVDPMARLASQNIEGKMAEKHPGQFAEGADFRKFWDQYSDRLDRGGAHRRGAAPDRDQLRGEAQEQDRQRDVHHDGREQAQTDEHTHTAGMDQAAEQQHDFREATALTTSSSTVTAEDRSEAARHTRLVGPGYAALSSKPKPAKAIGSSKPKAKALTQGRDRDRSKGGQKR